MLGWTILRGWLQKSNLETKSNTICKSFHRIWCTLGKCCSNSIELLVLCLGSYSIRTTVVINNVFHKGCLLHRFINCFLQKKSEKIKKVKWSKNNILHEHKRVTKLNSFTCHSSWSLIPSQATMNGFTFSRQSRRGIGGFSSMSGFDPKWGIKYSGSHSIYKRERHNHILYSLFLVLRSMHEVYKIIVLENKKKKERNFTMRLVS